MLLYWGVFTLGFMGGVFLTLGIFHQDIFSDQEKDLEQIQSDNSAEPSYKVGV